MLSKFPVFGGPFARVELATWLRKIPFKTFAASVGFALACWGAPWPLSAQDSTKLAVKKFEPTAQDKIVPAGARLELLYNEGEFTEGPAVDADGAIVFSDIGTRILRFDPVTKKTSVFRDPSGRANGLIFDQKGRLIACEGASPGGNRRISITEPDGKVRTLADKFDGKRFNSPNDLDVDPKGSLYFTDPRYGGDEPRELDFEGVFFVSADGAVKVATRDVEKPNGILVSADGKKVFVADNNSKADGNHHLVAFEVQADGTLAKKQILWNFGPNVRGIDGMTFDAAGNIYATAGKGDAAGIYVFSPAGGAMAFIPTPGDPTNCVFGIGAESQTLYITAEGPKPQDPAVKRRFALYRIGLAVPGRPRHDGKK
jgi:sugar lactone lactonase YvrE